MFRAQSGVIPHLVYAAECYTEPHVQQASSKVVMNQIGVLVDLQSSSLRIEWHICRDAFWFVLEMRPKGALPTHSVTGTQVQRTTHRSALGFCVRII